MVNPTVPRLKPKVQVQKADVSLRKLILAVYEYMSMPQRVLTRAAEIIADYVDIAADSTVNVSGNIIFDGDDTYNAKNLGIISTGTGKAPAFKTISMLRASLTEAFPPIVI